MSELTSCNFCNLNRIRRDAKAKNMKVTVLNAVVGGLGGSDVYVHPKDITISKLSREARECYFASWMMEIPDRCHC